MKTREEENKTVRVAHTDVDFEPRDANVGALLRLGLGILISMILIHTVVWWLYAYLRQTRALNSERGAVTEIQETVSPPPAPRLQLNPAADLQALESAQREQINSYGWVNQQDGIVKIPIEEAMRLIWQKKTAWMGKAVVAPDQAEKKRLPAPAANRASGGKGQIRQGR